jgi:hypothetical protein
MMTLRGRYVVEGRLTETQQEDQTFVKKLSKANSCSGQVYVYEQAESSYFDCEDKGNF